MGVKSLSERNVTLLQRTESLNLGLKPAMVLEVEIYSEARVSAWDEADRLDGAERSRVLKRLAAMK